jgi:enterochelin esterase-like enzyme
MSSACNLAQPVGEPVATAQVEPVTNTVHPPTPTTLEPHTVMPSPTPSPTATQACSEAHGQVIEDHYRGHNVQQDVPILVYLPPCYSAESGPYPVLYLLHGKPYNEHHWMNLGTIPVAEGLPPPPGPGWLMVFPRVPEPLFSNSDGGPGSYEGEFTQALMPYIDSAYAVRTDPAGRAIAGISRGGVWSLEIGLSHPELFDTVIALSPALAVNSPRPAYDPFTLVKTMAGLPPNIFLAAGDDDWAKPDTQKLVEALTQRGARAEADWVPGNHADATWIALLPDMLSFADQVLSPPREAP